MHGRLALALAICLGGCGDKSGGEAPDAAPDAEVFMICGNYIVEGSEECDDGNEDPDDGCSATCALECGDGVISGAELCDPGIPSGDPGACPTDESCTDDDPCTTGVVSGAGCEVTCEFATTTAEIDGDGCCPDGADATSDDDCTSICGNGAFEPPDETCDTAIAAGDPGACPTGCDDGDLCTADALVGDGTCDAHCTAPEITEIGPDDDCCPDGANAGNDPDCLGSCGDGFVTAPETCDTAIAPGNPGACPTACDDGDACTADALVNGGTCLDDCAETPIGAGPDDGCCPAGADLGDDPDCPPACGDGVVSAPETCDDGNTDAGDGCSAVCRIEPVGFRLRDLDLRDPHVFGSVPILGCTDLTNFDAFGQQGVNPALQTNIQTDEDGDGQLDLSILESFDPLLQAAGTMPVTDLVFPDCTDPMASTSCTLAAGAPHTIATASNLGSGTVCLQPEPNTVNTGYTPALVNPTAPGGGTCYVATAGTVTFDLGGIPITLEDARIAGEWFGSPATEIRDGMIRGFMTEARANATIIPEGTTGIDSIDGSPLSSLLRGGAGSCSQPAPATGDKDTLVGSSTVGWYFYLNFSAVRVPYTEQ